MAGKMDILRGFQRVMFAAALAVSAAGGAAILDMGPASAQDAGAKDKDKAKKKKKPRSAWVKLCDKAPISPKEKKEICITHHERLDGNTGMVLVSAAIRKIEGQKNERFMIMVPLGVALPPGVQVKVDDQKDPIKLRFSICHPGGCTAEVTASKEILEKLRKGNEMTVAAINALGKPIGFRVPLTGFTKAYEGGPIDSRKYAAARRRLMLLIRKRQIALAKKRAAARKAAAEKAAKKKKAE